MSLIPSRERAALGFGPDRVRLVVVKANGSVELRHSDSAELPAGALRSGLRAPTLQDPEAVLEVVRGLVEAARQQGHLVQAPELATIVLFDGAVKMALAPIEGEEPKGEEGDRMARWVLRQLLPGEPEEVRVDWSVARAPATASAGAEQLGGGAGETGQTRPGEGTGASRGSGAPEIFAVGAQDAVIREYEDLGRELGWTVGRVVPWTLAAAAASGEPLERTLVLCEGDGALASAFEDADRIRFHRAWKARVQAESLEGELSSLQRYVHDHLETTIAGVLTCGSEAWEAGATAACRATGLPFRGITPEHALTGALRG